MIIRFIVHYMGRRAASVFFATCPRSLLGQVVKKEVHIKAAKHSLSPRVNHLYRIPFAAPNTTCTDVVHDPGLGSVPSRPQPERASHRRSGACRSKSRRDRIPADDSNTVSPSVAAPK
jgi:hypothetical protein